jgi:hypothetical protein
MCRSMHQGVNFQPWSMYSVRLCFQELRHRWGSLVFYSRGLRPGFWTREAPPFRVIYYPLSGEYLIIDRFQTMVEFFFSQRSTTFFVLRSVTLEVHLTDESPKSPCSRVLFCQFHCPDFPIVTYRMTLKCHSVCNVF